MTKRKHKPFLKIKALSHFLQVVIGAAVLTLVLFLVLPMMQTLTKPSTSDLVLQSIDTAQLKAPDIPQELETEEEEMQQEQEIPELVEETPPLDLSQLEIALNPGFSGGMTGSGDFTVSLNTIVSSSKDDNVDAIFSMADLDQQPRVIYQSSPVFTKQLRQKTPGKVNVIFIVDEQGRVVEPRIKSSTDPIFEMPALNAVKRWKFEPGKRGGRPVRFRMLAPITFSKG